LLIEKVVLPHP
jgi:Icc-related predicted phosphoesterase